MKRYLLAATIVLATASGAAFAQSSPQPMMPMARSPALPLIIAPPIGTLSTTETRRITAPDGTTSDQTQTTYRDPDGVANQSKTTTTTPAPAVAETSNSASTTTTTVVTPVPWVRSCPMHNHYDPKTDSCVF